MAGYIENKDAVLKRLARVEGEDALGRPPTAAAA
jgi:hypothetical protein